MVLSGSSLDVSALISCGIHFTDMKIQNSLETICHTETSTIKSVLPTYSVKTQKLSFSQILREIDFGQSKISKATILTILQGLNFHFGEFFKFLGLKMPIYKFLSQSILREIKFPHFRAIKTLILTFSKYLNFNLRQFHFSPLQIFTKVNS